MRPALLLVLVTHLSLLLQACGGAGGGAGAVAPAITAQPTDQQVVVGSTATFGVTATGTAPLSYQWQKSGTAIAGASAASYTTPAATLADDGSAYAVVISNSAGSVTSAGAKLSVAGGTTMARGVDVTTYKNDLNRSGQNLSETALTLANVAPATFGLLRLLPVDGKVDAQPLYLSKLAVGSNFFNAVFVATEHGSMYAFDSDSGAMLWHVSLIPTGESPSDSRGCGQVTPEIGITSTPVIDRGAGPNGTIYVVAMSIDGSSNYHQRLHALDVATGAELAGPATISASYPTTGTATSTFDAKDYEERAALLLLNGTIYTSWTSHCDDAPYGGWVISFAQATLTRNGALNIAANSSAGPAIWMAGGGPAVDAAGNIYLLSANGAFETALDTNGFPGSQDFGNSFLKISPVAAGLSVLDYFTMSNEIAESNADQDLGSGGEMLLPDLVDSTNTVRHLMVGAGKDGNIYVVDRDAMGKFNASGNKNYQTLGGVLPGGIWSTPAYFNGMVYYADVSGTLKAFSIASAKLAATPQSQTTTQFAYPGTAPSVSANAAANAIIWADENPDGPGGTAVLHAYDATNLSHELYNSNMAAANRDQFGTANKYITPTVADGKVFVGTTDAVAVFGLLK
ncbi:MAG TPA: hypothetical protein VHW71_06660 [Steroidobacteraceae bacterium]|jgi:hypothetical protein|nr:hypothetical protein [Steroidobacteraceae bacterium]